MPEPDKEEIITEGPDFTPNWETEHDEPTEEDKLGEEVYEKQFAGDETSATSLSAGGDPTPAAGDGSPQNETPKEESTYGSRTTHA